MAFIMLNPLIADASIDDPTIVRCMGYARREGCDGIDVVNLFAYRSPAPTDLLEVEDPVGPDNDHHLREVIAGARFVVAGWGVWPAKPALARYDRPNHVVRIAREYDRQVSCLRRTKDGYPGHPLYLPGEAPLVPWAPT